MAIATPRADADAADWLALALVPGLGPVGQRQLLSAFGSPTAVFDQPQHEIARIIGPAVARALSRTAVEEGVQKGLAWLKDPSNQLLTLADEDYPKSLLETADPPVVMFLKGQRSLLTRTAIAIVGSRNATPGGIETANAFATALSNAGITVVSGLALGIDAAAHRGGLSGAGSSIAVVGTGLDLVYPAKNKTLAHELAQTGLIISEFCLGTPAIAGNFPRRNRIISGLSRGVLVVEAALASGSLITARLAGEQGREVFAIPGSIHSPFSKGCHQLIKQGAKLVDDANDILEELRWGHSAHHATTNPSASDDPILAVMGFDPVNVEQIVQRTGLLPQQVTARLTELELEGLISSLPGGKFEQIAG